MRLLRIPLAVLCMFLPAAALAQLAVKGTVVDQETKEPLAGAVILADDNATHATTDSRGRFELSSARPIRTITVRLIGYTSAEVAVPQNGESMYIQLAPSNIRLSEVQVVGVASEKKLLENASSVSLLTENDFRRNNEIFLQNTLNLVPGVQMNVRSASSQSNILIRGIGTYSRFSIRGVKLYMNGVPLTDADGTTTLEDIDFTTIGRAEVLRGPASSIYGSNLAGVVLLQTRKAPYGEISLNQGVTAGSYGLLRTNTTFMAGGDQVNSYVNYGHQHIDGFREHSESDKDFVTVASDFFLNDRQVVSVLANYTSIDENYAGEVDSAALYGNPEGAFPAYISKDIGLEADQKRLAVTHSYDFSSDFSNVTTLFTSDVSKVSPIEPRFSRTEQTKFGGRTLFTYAPVFGEMRTRLNFGAEYNSNYTISKAYQISSEGEPGEISGDNEVRAYQTNAFLQAEAEIVENTTLTAGASYNAVTYKNLDMIRTNLTVNSEFDPVITPRVALVHVFDDRVSVFAQFSMGFIPPTASQITLSGIKLPSYINTDLKPERNTSYELGSRGALLGDRLNYDLTLYRMAVTDALIQQTVSGVTAYVNAGSANYTGAEASLSYLIFSEEDVDGIQLLRPWVTFTYNDAKFDEYVLGTNDYSGNKVTGVAPMFLNAGVDFELDAGAYVNLTYQYIDEIPLRDDNTVYTEPHSLIGARAGYRARFGSNISCHLYAGADNLADTRYAATLAFNAGDGRYYAPAVGRNFYGGVTIGYIF